MPMGERSGRSDETQMTLHPDPVRRQALAQGDVGLIETVTATRLLASTIRARLAYTTLQTRSTAPMTTSRTGSEQDPVNRGRRPPRSPRRLRPRAPSIP